MEFVDKVLRCADCGQDFIFAAGEQLFFHDKQFKNDPKRCKPCKVKRAGSNRAAGSVVKAETRTQCSECAMETTVPFKPTQGRPVLCRSCFQKKRTSPQVQEASLPSVQPQLAAAPASLLVESAPQASL